ncbi:hypothetical protein L0F63_000472, partial [Massospora cicadina]
IEKERTQITAWIEAKYKYFNEEVEQLKALGDLVGELETTFFKVQSDYFPKEA